MISVNIYIYIYVDYISWEEENLQEPSFSRRRREIFWDFGSELCFFPPSKVPIRQLGGGKLTIWVDQSPIRAIYHDLQVVFSVDAMGKSCSC